MAEKEKRDMRSRSSRGSVVDPSELRENWTQEEEGRRVDIQRGVGMPAWIKLNNFGRVVAEFFGKHPYLVGSAIRTKQWRDVDVRLILSDEQFDANFGQLTRPRAINAKWNAACLAFAALGRQMTELPVDFQIDRETEANESYGDKPRQPLILTTIARTFDPETGHDPPNNGELREPPQSTPLSDA